MGSQLFVPGFISLTITVPQTVQSVLYNSTPYDQLYNDKNKVVFKQAAAILVAHKFTFVSLTKSYAKNLILLHSVALIDNLLLQ
ncbi:TPA: hypothetical protein DIC40_08555 [Patescibacteria group bacterium]|nr:hypothetical protein [Candidatus Gracilibacteria bacterium]